jgi:hypothetical protein
VLLATDTPPRLAEEVRVGLAGLEAAARVVRVDRGLDPQLPFHVGAAFEAPVSDDAVLARASIHSAGRPPRGAPTR